MKDSTKTKPNGDTARDLFAELREGLKALAEERLGKRSLLTVRPQLAKRERNRK